MWFLMSLLQIPFTARMTNDRGLNLAGVRRGLMRVVRKRHIDKKLLRERCALRKDRGEASEEQATNQNWTSLMEDILRNIRFVDLVVMAQDHSDWCSMVARVNKNMAHP